MTKVRRFGVLVGLLLPLIAAAASIVNHGSRLFVQEEPPAEFTFQSLQFQNTGDFNFDAVRIPQNSTTIGANVGSGDITIEMWLRPAASGNNQGAVSTGSGQYSWITGNIFFDRDRYNQARGHGASLTDGRVTFGVNCNGTTGGTGWYTARGTTDIRDGQWHHVAITRAISNGAIQIYVDGTREANTGAITPTCSLQYPDGATPLSLCPNPSPSSPCTYSDPYIYIGKEKHDVDPSTYPGIVGNATELRLSTVIRYTGATITVPTARFTVDGDTAALWHFQTNDSNATTLECEVDPENDGEVLIGGSPVSPAWSTASPF